MTNEEKELIKISECLIESYDLSMNYFANKNEYICGALGGFFIEVEKHRKRIKDIEERNKI